jgi:hypothetical protein
MVGCARRACSRRQTAVDADGRNCHNCHNRHNRQDIYLARAEGELELEEELYTALIKVRGGDVM